MHALHDNSCYRLRMSVQGLVEKLIRFTLRVDIERRASV